MAYSPIIYSHAGDDLFAAAILAGTATLVDGTLDTGYSLSDLANGDPAAGVVFTTDHWAITIDHGSAVSLQLPALIHSNGRSTTTFTIMRNATNSWGAPTTSYTLTLTDADTDGLRPNAWKDRRSDTALRWTKIVAAANGTNWRVGQIVLASTLKQLDHNVPDLPQFAPTTRTAVNQTSAGVKFKTQKGVRQKTFRPAAGFQTAAGLAQVQAWAQSAAGTAKNFLFVPIPEVNDCWYAEFDADIVYALFGPAGLAKGVTLPINEIARGQVWP